MKFEKFIIHSYKAITNDLVIDLSKEKVMALIGLNECGKSTILKAITAFDSRCDKYKDDYLQFNDLENKYYLAGQADNLSEVSAFICIEEEEKEKIREHIISKNLFKKNKDNVDIFQKEVQEVSNPATPTEIVTTKVVFDEEKYKQAVNELTNRPIQVKRIFNSTTKNYFIISEKFPDLKQDEQNSFVEYILNFCPEILFFSDKLEFKDEISLTDTSISKKIVDNLFKSVANYNVKEFFDSLNQDQQGSYISDINGKLNEEFMQKWNSLSINHNFGKLSLEVSHQDKKIYFKVAESININDETGKSVEKKRWFSLKDRSAGFNWYFRFVLTLLYYPSAEKQVNQSKIYLFDEPGLFLHENAQINLSKTFQTLSRNNTIIYTTHCHGMLNIDLSYSEDAFSLKNIFIVSKEPNEYIKLSPSFDYVDKSCKDSRSSSIKPIMHALQLGFTSFIQGINPVVIVEGVNDFYILKGILRDKLGDIQIFPSMGADNVEKHIPYFLMNGNPFVILFDNDEKGFKCADSIKVNFGEEIFRKVLLLPENGYFKTENVDDKFEMDDYFNANKDRYRQQLKIRGKRAWYSEFAEKIYKKDYTDLIYQIDESLKPKFEVLLGQIKSKLR